MATAGTYPVVVMPNSVKAVRSWLNSRDGALHGRWFTATPNNAKAPYATLRRIGGAADGDVPIDVAIYALRIAAARWSDAWDMAQATAAEIKALSGGTVSGVARLGGGRVLDGPREVPDDEARLAVITLDVEVTTYPVRNEPL